MSQAKDKAKELVEMLKYVARPSKKSTLKMCIHPEQAKQCALICVDEMIQEIEDFPYAYKFWTEVKQEIKKLK